MNQHTSRSLNLTITTIVLCLFGFCPAVQAVDGVVEINQARALKGGVTAGDTAGFPVRIGASGSYRLTGDLTVPDENTGAIVVAADGGSVTIDLNGFSIKGPGILGTQPGSGVRVFDSVLVDSLRVVNGTIQGMGGRGIDTGTASPTVNAAHVERITVTGNALDGIQLFKALSSVVSGCTASGNGILAIDGWGIRTGDSATIVNNAVRGNLDGILAGVAGAAGGVVIRENTVAGNLGNGINASQATVSQNVVVSNGTHGVVVSYGTVIGNTILDNGQNGLIANGDVGYATNVISGNGFTVAGGVQIGLNYCDGDTTCP